MNGGDTDTGGAQVNPSTAPINTPGLRPVDAVVPDNDSDADSATTLTISHDDQPSPTLSSLPSTDSVSQPSEPTVRPIIPTPSSVSTSQFTPPAINAAPVSSLGTPSTQPSAPVVPPVGMQQPTATPIISPVPPAQSADQLISQTFASSTSSSQPTIATPVAPLQPSQPTQPLAAPTLLSQGPQPISPAQSFQSAQPPMSTPFIPQQPTMQSSAQPIFSTDEDIIIGTPAITKSHKSLIITLISLAALIIATVAVLVATGVIGGNVTTTPPGSERELSTKQEVYGTLFDFNFQYYSSILDNYNNTIGLIPDLRLSDYNILLPAEQFIPTLTTEVDKAIRSYNDISPVLPDILRDGDKTIDIQSTKEAITVSMQTMQENLSTINDFYNAYYYPLLQTPRPSTCDKTPEMLALEQGPTLIAASQYYSLYCEALTFLSQSDDYTLLKQEIATQATDAANSLNQLLVNVPSAQSQINTLFMELTQ